MSIDPGFGGTGLAFWQGGELQHSMVVTAPKSQDWWDRASYIGHTVTRHACDTDALFAFYEQPYFIPGSIGNARQDITILTTLAGIISGMLDCNGLSVYPVAVPDWKGQTPKDITQVRIKQRVPNHRWTSKAGHDVDAVGVGLYVQGRF